MYHLRRMFFKTKIDSPLGFSLSGNFIADTKTFFYLPGGLHPYAHHHNPLHPSLTDNHHSRYKPSHSSSLPLIYTFTLTSHYFNLSPSPHTCYPTLTLITLPSHLTPSPHTCHPPLTPIILPSHLSPSPHTYHLPLTLIILPSHLSPSPHTYHSPLTLITLSSPHKSHTLTTSFTAAGRTSLTC